MASVRTDDGPDGKRNDFEAAASHLLPYDPVAKRRLASKRSNPQISSVQEAEDNRRIGYCEQHLDATEEVHR